MKPRSNALRLNRKAISTGMGILAGIALILLVTVGAMAATGRLGNTGNGSGPGCGAGTHLNLISGLCEPDAAPDDTGHDTGVTSAFHGTLSLTVTSIDGDTNAALALTNAVFDLYDSAMVEEKVCTQATSVDHTIGASDKGKMNLIIEYKTNTVGFVDPEKTIAKNKDYMAPGSMYLKDVNNDGQLDQVYPVDFGWLSEAGSTGKATASLSLVAWNSDSAVTLTADTGGSPTGMHTAGDYHATGYVAAITSTYMWQVQRIWISSNSSGMGALFTAGTSYLVKFSLTGTGPQTDTDYGGAWLRQDFYNPNYDSAQYVWDIYRAHNGNGWNKDSLTTATDISQVNYGMSFVNERMSPTTWLSFDIWIHTTGDMTSGSVYDGTDFTLNIRCTNPAGTQHSDTLAYTLTG